MQKAFVQMNLQLPLVVSDITGVTGLRILRDIVAGQRDPHRLGAHRDYRCRASEPRLSQPSPAITAPEHVFVLQQNLELFDVYQRQLTACDVAIEAHLATLTAAGRAAADAAAGRRVAGRNRATTSRASTSARLLHQLSGVDLSQIDPPPVCAS